MTTGTESQAARTDSFCLTKWYMDCVGGNGDALIGYRAELRWRRFTGHYTGALLFTGGSLEEFHTLRSGPGPQISGGVLEWSSDPLGVTGLWTGSAHPRISRVLLGRGSGRLEWHCIQPLAEAAVRCGRRHIRGRGYTECVRLTVAPWELPIDELRWGRAHFPGRSVVWIDWTGDEPMRLVLVDGHEVEGVWVCDDLVATRRTTVRLTDKRMLREGPIAMTSAGRVPGVRQALSSAGLLIDERKWLSAALLEEDGAVLRGEAVHEVVKWR